MTQEATRTVIDHMNGAAQRWRESKEFRDRCCMVWKQLIEDEGLGDAVARNSAAVFNPRLSDAQIDAIRDWPTQVHLFLKDFIHRIVCPGPVPPPKVKFEGIEDGKVPRSVTISIDANNEAKVIFTMEKII
jgi:hypothetical protein